MSFNLNDAPKRTENTTTKSNYTKPGIQNNTVATEVVLGESSIQKVPYMEIRTKGPNGELGKSNKMFLSTTVGEGKKMSAWAMTSRNITDLIMATHNVDEATAKQMFGEATSNEDVVAKTAALIIGKPFRGKYRGEEGRNGTIYASLDSVESMNVPQSESKLRFNEARDIKYQGANNETSNSSDAVAVTEEETNDLPF